MLANDLNPVSYKYLQQNIALNKVQKSVTASNMDGRAFIRLQCNLAQAAAQPLTQKGISQLAAVTALHMSHGPPCGNAHAISTCTVWLSCGKNRRVFAAGYHNGNIQHSEVAGSVEQQESVFG